MTRWRPERWLISAAMIVGGILFTTQIAEIPWRSALRGYDNTFNYLWLRSVMVDGDWDFRNDLVVCDTIAESEREGVLAVEITETGRIPNKYGIGWALVSVPAYLWADMTVATGNAMGFWKLERDGFNPVYQIFLQAWQFSLAVLGLMLVRAILVRWIEPRFAWAGILTVWLASPLIYYQTVSLSMSHNTVFFAVAVMLFGVCEAQNQKNAPWPWLLAGCGFGLAVVSRFQAGVFAIVLIWLLWKGAQRQGWAVLHPIGYLVSGALPFVLIQMWAWKIVYGRWLVFSYGQNGEGFSWVSPELGASLFSPFHGMFYWHPLLAISFAGMLWWAWKSRGPAVPLVAVVFATIYVNAAWWCWWFAASFGIRAFDAALIPMMAGQAYLFQRTSGAARRVLWGACIALAFWNVYVATLYRSAAIPRNEPVTWADMIRAARELPEHLKF